MFNLIAAIVMAISIVAAAILCALEYARDRKGDAITREKGLAALILGAGMIILLTAFIGGTFHIASRETASIIGIVSATIMLPGVSAAVLISRITLNRAA